MALAEEQWLKLSCLLLPLPQLCEASPVAPDVLGAAKVMQRHFLEVTRGCKGQWLVVPRVLGTWPGLRLLAGSCKGRVGCYSSTQCTGVVSVPRV